jgi:succinate dehydrogenase / fumarate reductase flavoprotein subunit
VRALSTTPKADDEQVTIAVRAATAPLNRESGENPYLLHEALQDIMGPNVGIVRDEEGLKKGIDELETLKARVSNVKAPGASQYNPGWNVALDLPSLMITSEAVARAGLMRQESRGAHTRLDYEGEREEWLPYNIVVRKKADGEMEVEKVERPAPPAALKAIAQATIEDLESGKVGKDVT